MSSHFLPLVYAIFLLNFSVPGFLPDLTMNGLSDLFHSFASMILSFDELINEDGF